MTVEAWVCRPSVTLLASFPFLPLKEKSRYMRSAWCLGSGGFKTLIYVDYTVERKSSLQKNNAMVLWVSVISVYLSYCSFYSLPLNFIYSK